MPKAKIGLLGLAVLALLVTMFVLVASDSSYSQTSSPSSRPSLIFVIGTTYNITTVGQKPFGCVVKDKRDPWIKCAVNATNTVELKHDTWINGFQIVSFE
jgi:hypothetical protein